MLHAFVLDIFLRVLATTGVLIGGAVLYFLVPLLLQFVFRRVTGIEKDARSLFRKQHSGLEYIEASYWRTNFFLLLYFIIRATILTSALFVAFWIWHYDLLYVIFGIGIYGLVIVFNAGEFVRNIVAHLWLVSTGTVKLGQRIDVAGTYGVVVAMTGMHIVVVDPEILTSTKSSDIGQVTNPAGFARAVQKSHGSAHAVPAATRAGLHFIPNNNLLAYVTTTTNTHHFYPYLDPASTHRA